VEIVESLGHQSELIPVAMIVRFSRSIMLRLKFAALNSCVCSSSGKSATTAVALAKEEVGPSVVPPLSVIPMGKALLAPT
jgi:hypothetical protein